MFNFIEKFFFKRMLKKIAKLIPYGQDKIKEIWEENKEEIIEKSREAIEKIVKDIIKRVLHEKGIKIIDDADT